MAINKLLAKFWVSLHANLCVFTCSHFFTFLCEVCSFTLRFEFTESKLVKLTYFTFHFMVIVSSEINRSLPESIKIASRVSRENLALRRFGIQDVCVLGNKLGSEGNIERVNFQYTISENDILFNRNP